MSSSPLPTRRRITAAQTARGKARRARDGVSRPQAFRARQVRGKAQPPRRPKAGCLSSSAAL
eukprot:4217057-Pyramimonas_sp.AAC.1